MKGIVQVDLSKPEQVTKPKKSRKPNKSAGKRKNKKGA